MPPLKALVLLISRKASRCMSKQWTGAAGCTLGHILSALHATSREGSVRGTVDGRPRASQRSCVAPGEVHVWNRGRKQLVGEGRHRAVGGLWVCKQIQPNGAILRTSHWGETRINSSFPIENYHFHTTVGNWQQELVATCRVMTSETHDRPPGNLFKNFNCADVVVVLLHWAPDCRHKCGL